MSKIKSVMMLVLALLLAVQGMGITNAQAASTIDKLTAEYLFESLGDAVNYGIVARQWDQEGHSETSICVDVINRIGQISFSNSEKTYLHALGYELHAEVSAPTGASLKDMEFALYQKSGNEYVRCKDTEITVQDDVSTATLTWKIDNLKNERLYVFQTKDEGYVSDGGINEDGLVVTYGNDIMASAQNEIYIGKFVSPRFINEDSAMLIYNGPYDHSPALVFGKETKIYMRVGQEYREIDPANPPVSSDSATVYVNYYYPETEGGESTKVGYCKCDVVVLKDGKFYIGGKTVNISTTNRSGYVADLLNDAKKLSKELGNMGGGVISDQSIPPKGPSTVTGPISESGYFVSLYDVEVGSDSIFRVKDDMGWAGDYRVNDNKKVGIPIQDNEYVVVNLICPMEKDENGNLVPLKDQNGKTIPIQMGTDASDITYFYREGQTGGEKADWENKDSKCSQRVIYNYVYTDENGVLQPYPGSVIPGEHGGTLLIPAGHVHNDAKDYNGAVIADTAWNGQEFHQRTLKPLNRSTWVKMNGGWLELQKASVGYDWGADKRWEDMSDQVSLAGAEFGVYSDPRCTKDSLIMTMETDAQGKAQSELLAAGDYWVKEITPLKDHELNTKVINVKVVAGETVMVQGGGYKADEGYWVISDRSKFVNEQNEGAVNLRLLKHDEFGEPVQGVVFGIYDHENKLVGTMKTNRNGVAEYEGLPLRFSYDMYGNKTPRPYYVKENSAPDGYWLDGTVVTLRLEKEQQNLTIVVGPRGAGDSTAFVNNIKRGNLRISKVSAHNNMPLGGAEFTIYSDKDCKNAVATITTGKNGIATTENVVVNKQTGLKGLLPGTYYVKETKAPERYLLPDPAPVYTVKVVHSKITDVTAEPIGNHAVISIAGNKVWHDKGFDNNRPSEVQIEIYKGSEYVTGAKVSAANNWTFRFENLRRYDDDGNEITYTIKENLGGRGYEYYTYINKVDQNGNITATVANSIKKTKIDGVKIWEKGDNDAELPDTITFLLYQKVGEKDVPVLDGQGNQMKCTGRKYENYKFWFSDLPTYAADGEDAVYVVKEEPSDHYMQIDSKFTSETNGGITSLMFTLTNRQTVALEGTKVWQDSNNPKRPDHITLKVSCNGVEMKTQPEVTWGSKEGDVWSWKISGLDKYDENGNLNVYTVKETIPAGYKSSQTTNADGTITIYNMIPGSIRLYKVWVDWAGENQPLNGAEFKLYYDAGCQNAVSDHVYVTADVSSTRKGFIEILNLAPGDYYIREEKAPVGFALPNPNRPIKVTVKADQVTRVNGEHGVVVNYPSFQSTTVYVEKKWVGDENKTEARPDSITVQLYENGSPYVGYPGYNNTLELNASNNWEGAFTQLPDKDYWTNRVYNYSVKETSVVPNYHTQVSGSLATGFTITNTYNLTSITAEKKWVGVALTDALEVTFQLYADGNPVSGKTAVLNNTNDWKCTFADLPIKDLQTGEPIVYTVKETAVDGFTSSGDGTADNNYTITNTVIGGQITLKKVDGDNGNPLFGAKFGIYSDKTCNTLVAEMTTGNDGVATSDRLKAGTYYVKETQAPQDYQIGHNDAVEVEVVRDQTVTVRGDRANGDFTNVKRAIVYINKVEAELNEWNQPDKNTVKPLKGAKFTIYSDANCTKVEAVMETDENGYAEAALIPGRQYWIKETEAPAGYEILVTSTHNFWANLGNPMKLTWGNWDQNVDGAMVNVKVKSAVGAITLTKADAADSSNKKLAGAVFGVYEDENLKYTMEATDENGKSTLINIPVGKYYVQEITAPAGYKLDTMKYEVEVMAGGVAVVNNGNVIPNTMKEGEASFSFVKKLEIKQANVTGEVYRFTFTLMPDGNTPDTYSVTATNADQYTVTPVKDADGKITHYEVTVTMPAVPENASDVQQKIGLDFKFKKVGTYTFTLQEKQPDSIDDGWYYDTVERVITFNVVEGTDKLDVTRVDTIGEPTVNNGIEKAYISFWKKWHEAEVPADQTAVDELLGNITLQYQLEGNAGQTTVGKLSELKAGNKLSVEVDTSTASSDGTWNIKVSQLPAFINGAKVAQWSCVETLPEGSPYEVVHNGSLDDLTTDKGMVAAGEVIHNVRQVEVTFAGTKFISGREMSEADIYTFEITEKDNSIWTGQNEVGGKIKYPTLTYGLSDLGEHTYTVKETSVDANGIVVDKTEHQVTVNVFVENGLLCASTSDNIDKLDFTNTYVTASITLDVVKVLNGRDFQEGDEFTFTVSAAKGVPMPEKTSVKIEPTSGKEAAVDFGVITYTQADAGKEYIYTVKETKGTLAGITYDEAEYTVTVKIADNKDGTLNVAKAYAENATQITITNTYTKPANGQVKLNVKKVLEGRDFQAGDEFTFTVSAETGVPLPEQTSVKIEPTSGKEAVVDFGLITYTQADAGKEYIYTVQEIKDETKDAIKGVTYDTTIYTVEVSIAAADDGTLTVTPNYGEGKSEIAITNKYNATGTAKLDVEKHMVGRDFQQGDVFTFTVSAAEGVPMPPHTTVEIKPTSGKEADVDFGLITYTQADAGKEYIYTVKETKGTLAGITYDEAEYTVTVAIEDKKDGTLNVTETYAENATQITITNTYTASGKLKLNVYKEMVNREFQEGDEFTFEVSAAEGVPMPEQTSVTIRPTSGDTAVVDFGEIDYTMLDVGQTYKYTYKLKENAGSLPGVSYDDQEYTVTVTVGDNGTGTLVANAVYPTDDKVVFTNTYTKPANGQVKLNVTKVLDGRDFQEGDVFTFTVSAAEGVPMPEKTSVKIEPTSGKEAVVDFGLINYTQADVGKTYAYTVQEIKDETKDAIKGVTYDTTIYTVEVSITEADDGTLTVTPNYGEGKSEIAITNKYNATGTAKLDVEKHMVGRDFQQGDVFTFTVSAAEGVPMPPHTTVEIKPTSGKEADVDFGLITYTQADAGKEYIYTVKETKGTLAGITYDEAEYTVTVAIEDKKDGTLNVTETYAENATQITITNTYTASGKLKLNVYKEMVNREFQEGDEFTFEVSAAEGVPMPPHTTVEISPTSGNTATVDFGEIDYTELDVGQTYTYTYKLKESKGSLPGVTYDETEYTVTVTVADNGDGTLVANAIYPTDNKVVFTNIYTQPANAQLKLNVEKVMAGRDFKTGDAFTFTVSAENGVPMPEQASVTINPTSGNTATVDFGAITYTQADAGKTYTYTVEEVAGNIANMVYDRNRYTVNVTITANADGTLTVTPVYQAGEKITLTNTHITQYECKLTMAATKAITGTARRAVPAPAFDFAVYVDVVDGEAPDYMGWNTDDGTIVFEDIVYTLEDVGRKYLYQVLEVKGADQDDTFDYVNWDNTVFTVEVDVFLNDQGQVTYSEPIYREGALMTRGISFTNEVNYRVGSMTLKKVDSTNTARGLAGAEFGVYTDLACTDLVGTILTDDKGEGGLEGLKFGTYYVKETEAPQGYVRSDKVYTVEIREDDQPVVVNEANGGYITNDRISEVIDVWTSFTVRKVWQGKHGGEIDLVLFANGVMMDPQPTPIRNGDVYTYVNLPKYDANGLRITYTAKETSMVNYVTSYKNPMPYANETNFVYDGGVIINHEMTSFAVRKIWTGLKEGETVPAIKLLLYCNGELYTEVMPAPTADGWYIYHNLPSVVNGVKAVYTVKEEPLSGWLTVYTNTGDVADSDCAYNGGTIQNSKIPQTGDNGHQSLWMALMALVMVGWAALRALERKWGIN